MSWVWWTSGRLARSACSTSHLCPLNPIWPSKHLFITCMLICLDSVVQWLHIDLWTRRSSSAPCQGTFLHCGPDPQCGMCRRINDSLPSMLFLYLTPSLSLKRVKNMYFSISMWIAFLPFEAPDLYPLLNSGWHTNHKCLLVYLPSHSCGSLFIEN